MSIFYKITNALHISARKTLVNKKFVEGFNDR